jgi:hypothetical protein
MTTTSEPTTAAATTPPVISTDPTATYDKCGASPNVSRGCGRTLATEGEQHRGVCSIFPLCS